jgi:acetate kinase
MIAVLDGIDLLVFTGGIGDNDAEVRSAIYSGLSWVGVKLCAARSRSARHPIRFGALRCAVNEQITRHAWAWVPA